MAVAVSPWDERVFVGLGGNLGPVQTTLEAALEALAAHPEVRLQACSPWYRSAPVDAVGPDFLNAVAELRTGLQPLALLDLLQALEHDGGRERPYHHAPRRIDLDLLFFGTRVMAHPRLALPHPRAHTRAFVLRPLLDLEPQWAWPDGTPALAHWPGVAHQSLHPA